MSRIPRVSILSILTILLAANWNMPAFADPPGWAPAHGYREHHHDRDRDRDRYRERRRDDDRHVAVVPFGINLGRCNREQLGQVLGGLAGAVIGSTARGRDRPVAIIGGAILGALIGGQIGRSMDEVDQYCIGQTLEYAKAGQTITWNNPDSGAEYKVTPQAATVAPSGAYCREYQTTIIVEGKEQQAYGRACRQPDGSWKKVD